MDFKIIQDTIFGSMRFERPILDLMETLEIQRLNGIKQLGLTYLVFPGANHTRIEHSLGCCHLAQRIGEVLHLPEDERLSVSAAALLHDIGHGPFSHTLEHYISELSGLDHMLLTKKAIRGEEEMIVGSERETFNDIPTVPEVLERHGLDSKQVSDIMMGSRESGFSRLTDFGGQKASHERRYLSQMIHGPIDVDQIDYLLRDSHYTGVAHGTIDADRLIQTIQIHNNDLVIDKKGMSSVEGMLVARALMYSSVYFHKTVRVAELMLARAVERAAEPNYDSIQRMVDSELMSWLLSKGGLQHDMAMRIKYRKLFKKAFVLEEKDLDGAKREALSRLTDFKRRREKEDSIADRAGARRGEVILDMPRPELLTTEPRMSQLDVRILDGTKARPLKRMSGLSKTLRSREVSDWVLLVSCEYKHKEAVGKYAPKVIFG
ncbi:MAG: HD domain-containing protein [Thermoplasmata archaeon]